MVPPPRPESFYIQPQTYSNIESGIPFRSFVTQETQQSVRSKRLGGEGGRSYQSTHGQISFLHGICYTGWHITRARSLGYTVSRIYLFQKKSASCGTFYSFTLFVSFQYVSHSSNLSRQVQNKTRNTWGMCQLYSIFLEYPRSIVYCILNSK